MCKYRSSIVHCTRILLYSSITDTILWLKYIYTMYYFTLINLKLPVSQLTGFSLDV